MTEIKKTMEINQKSIEKNKNRDKITAYLQSTQCHQ